MRDRELEPIVRWRESNRDPMTNIVWQWDLMVDGRSVATVWKNLGNEATWHTWDRDGVGGENDVEHEDSPEEAVRRAKVEACASAVAQGFV